MNISPSSTELIGIANQLSAEQLSAVLEYARSVKPPPSRTGKDILAFAGTLPDDDAREMMAAIEEDCERVDDDAW